MAVRSPAMGGDPSRAGAVPLVVWGVGTGRHLVEPATRGAPTVVLAIDVDPTVPEAHARAHELAAGGGSAVAAAIARGTLRIVVAPAQELAAVFQALGASGRGDMIVHLPALAAAPPAAQPLARVIERVHLEQLEAPRHRARLLHNLRANADALAQAQPLSRLAGLAEGRPAFVLAAGPSLAEHLGLVLHLRGLGPVIAVDTALPLARRAGLAIDVLCTVDPFPASAAHLREGSEGVGWLAMQPFACPELVAAFPQRAAAVPSGDRLAAAVGHTLGLPEVHAAGTVLVFALQVAALLGARPIVLVGADLAHVGGMSHAAGTAHAQAIRDVGVTSRTTSGHPVPTTRTLQRFQAEVEGFAAELALADGVVEPVPPAVAGPRGSSGQLLARSRVWAVDGGGAALAGIPMLHALQLDGALALLDPARYAEALDEPARADELVRPSTQALHDAALAEGAAPGNHVEAAVHAGERAARVRAVAGEFDSPPRPSQHPGA